jgi:membrane protease YdiL (CAAX protease family)
MWWLSAVRWEPIARIRHEIDGTIVPLFERASVLHIALLSAVAGIGEEALFRGVIQGAVAARSYAVAGLVVASVLFGLAHLVTRTYAVLAGLIGAYLGMLLLVFDNLLVPIVVHAVYDFVALWYLLGGRTRLGSQGGLLGR